MDLKHLGQHLPAFLDELEKDAGLKDDLKVGTKKVLTALKSVPEKANNATLHAAVKVQQHVPHVDKLMTHGPDILRKLIA